MKTDLKEFEVTIIHTVRETYSETIYAKDEDEAYEIAENRYLDGEYDGKFENSLDERSPGGWGYEIEVDEY